MQRLGKAQTKHLLYEKVWQIALSYCQVRAAISGGASFAAPYAGGGAEANKARATPLVLTQISLTQSSKRCSKEAELIKHLSRVDAVLVVEACD
jgi:hypothetical protein